MNRKSRPTAQGCRRRPGRCLWLMMIFLALAGCSSLPQIKPSGLTGNGDIRERCRSVFPAAPHQFTHAIEFSMPDGSRSTALGIVLVDSSRQMIHSVIMTVEGFVLFDARRHRLLTVNRAVAPFDAPGFAEKIMADVSLIFSPPAGQLTEAGVLENGFIVCRYRDEAGLTTDVMANEDIGWAVHQYDDDGRMSRQVRAYVQAVGGIPERIELSHHQFPRYGLNLTLLQAEQLSADDERLKK